METASNLSQNRPKCPYCQYRFNLANVAANMEEHLDLVHNKLAAVFRVEKNTYIALRSEYDAPYECPVNDCAAVTFDDRRGLELHVYHVHHPNTAVPQPMQLNNVSKNNTPMSKNRLQNQQDKENIYRGRSSTSSITPPPPSTAFSSYTILRSGRLIEQSPTPSAAPLSQSRRPLSNAASQSISTNTITEDQTTKTVRAQLLKSFATKLPVSKRTETSKPPTPKKRGRPPKNPLLQKKIAPVSISNAVSQSSRAPYQPQPRPQVSTQPLADSAASRPPLQSSSISAPRTSNPGSTPGRRQLHWATDGRLTPMSSPRTGDSAGSSALPAGSTINSNPGTGDGSQVSRPPCSTSSSTTAQRREEEGGNDEYDKYFDDVGDDYEDAVNAKRHIGERGGDGSGGGGRGNNNQREVGSQPNPNEDEDEDDVPTMFPPLHGGHFEFTVPLKGSEASSQSSRVATPSRLLRIPTPGPLGTQIQPHQQPRLSAFKPSITHLTPIASTSRILASPGPQSTATKRRFSDYSPDSSATVIASSSRAPSVDGLSPVLSSKSATKRRRCFRPSVGHWEPDGMLVIQAQDVRFKVHAERLTRMSEWFRERLEAPDVNGEDGPDDRVINLDDLEMNVRAEDFEILLNALDESIDYASTPPPFPTLTAILRASTELRFTRHSAWAAARLQTLFSPALDKLPATATVARTNLAVEVLRLGREYRVPAVLRPAFYELLRAPILVEMAVIEEAQNGDGAMNVDRPPMLPIDDHLRWVRELSPGDLVKLITAKERLSRTWLKLAGVHGSLEKFPPCINSEGPIDSSSSRAAPRQRQNCVEESLGRVEAQRMKFERFSPDLSECGPSRVNPRSTAANVATGRKCISGDIEKVQSVHRRLIYESGIFNDYARDVVGGMNAMIGAPWQGEGGLCKACVEKRQKVWVEERDKVWAQVEEWIGIGA